jgi:hypothetical protein
MRHAGFVDPASSGATYRRPVFSRLGVYDESFDACEDVEFNTRVAAAGYKAYTDPRLAVYYAPRQSVRALFRQMARYGVGRVRLARKHPEGISTSQWAPAVLLAFLFLGIFSILAAAGTGFWPIALAAVPAALFLAIILAASVDLGRRHGWRHAVIGPAAYCAVYCGLGWGMWKESLRAFFKRLHRESPAVWKKGSESGRKGLIQEEWPDQSGSAAVTGDPSQQLRK